MMKSTRLFAKAGLVAALFALAGAASAQVTASKGISVTATLTSKCQVATGSAGAITMAFGTYVAFVGPATAPQQTVNFECTRGLSAAPTFAWDTTNGTNTGEGVIAGLRYSLTATNGTVSTGTAPDLAVANDLGTPTVRPVLIDGTMPAGQAGTDSSGPQTQVRTLTVTF
jgi:hypothetical protein